MVAGTGDFAPDADGIPAVLVGRILANDLEISAGDYVTLTSPQGNLTPFGMLPRSRRFRVTGVFDSGFYDYDANWGFVTLPAAQALAGIGDVVSLLEVRVTHLDDASAIAAELLKRAGNGFTTTTWMDENRALFRALSLEKLVTALFIGLITFVAGLNILVVLTMTVTDRARDIAVLMAMGARRQQIRKIFILQGLGCEHCGDSRRLAARIRVRGDCQSVAIDPAQSRSVRDSLCAVSRQRVRRHLDRRGGAGYQHGGDDSAGALRRTYPACRNSALRIKCALWMLKICAKPPAFRVRSVLESNKKRNWGCDQGLRFARVKGLLEVTVRQ